MTQASKICDIGVIASPGSTAFWRGTRGTLTAWGNVASTKRDVAQGSLSRNGSGQGPKMDSSFDGGRTEIPLWNKRKWRTRNISWTTLYY